MGEVIKDFLARRYAQIYVDKYKKQGHAQAEVWIRGKVRSEELREFQKYIIEEMKSRGYKNIVPGDIPPPEVS